jgi:hypothetical protein
MTIRNREKMRTNESQVAAHVPCLSTDACIQAPLVLPSRRVIRHLLVGGSAYQLVLFYQAEGRLSKQPVCTPFSFRVTLDREMEAESFLSCPGAPLPTSLDAPGYLTRDGRLYLNREFVLDGSVLVHNLTFTLRAGQVALFRAESAQHSVVDVDLRLLAPNNTVIATSTFPRPMQERLLGHLVDSGTYTLEISYWGQFAADACETFHLVVSLAPESAAAHYCDGLGADLPLVVPDQSVSSEVPTSSWRSNPMHPLTYGNRSGFPLNATTFAVDTSVTNARLLVRVGQDFLMGSLNVYLQSFNTDTRRFATNKGSFLELSEYLQAGFYTLVIALGDPSVDTARTGDVSVFPGCIRFSLELNLTADLPGVDSAQSQSCWQWPQLPSTLEQPQFLGTPSRQMYMWGRFLTPPRAFDDRVITFEGGEVPTMLRAYMDPHEDQGMDLDLLLRQDGQLVANSVGLAGLAEQITFSLQPKAEYELVVRAYTNRPGQLCDSFGFEMAIEPFPADLWSGPCPGGEVMPAIDWIPSGSQQWPWSQINDFRFTQTVTESRTFLLNLNLTEPAFVRVRTSYEFIWGALTMSLLNGDGEWMQDGTGGANTNNLGTLRLDPGNYTLRFRNSGTPIYLGADRGVRCNAFEIHASIDSASDGDEEVGPHGSEHPCSRFPLPTTLNAPFALHPLSGNQVHESRSLLIQTAAPPGDSVAFEIKEDSLLRVYVPHLEDIDVDIKLESADNTSTCSPCFATIGRGEESRVRRLPVGRYVLSTKYYQQQGGHALPPTRACEGFPLQFAIVPMTLVMASPSAHGGGACASSEPPAALNVTGSDVYSHAVSSSTTGWSRNISIALSSDSVLRFEIESDFATSPIWAKAVSTDAGSVARTLRPLMGLSRALFYTTLDRGNWQLTLYYPQSDDTTPSPSEIVCNKFRFGYRLDGGVSSACNLHALPDDLSSLQDVSTGALHWYEQNLRAPKKGAKQYVRFNVTKPSIWRLSIESVGDTVIDVDMKLYNSTAAANATFLRAISNSGGRYEDIKLFLAPARPNDAYLLELTSFSVRHQSALDCPSITVFMAMAPASDVLDQRLCPLQSNPTLPPTALTFAASNNTTAYTQSFALDHDTLRPFLSRFQWSFEISLEVRENTTLVAKAGSNFLASDATLALSPHAVPVSAVGLPSSGADEDFFAGIQTLLTPGLYKLYVEGKRRTDVWSAAGEALDQDCVRFSLDVRATTSSPGQPRIVSVTPGSSYGMNPQVCRREISALF